MLKQIINLFFVSLSLEAVLLNIENDINDKNCSILIKVHPITKSIGYNRANISIKAGDVLELSINKGPLKESNYYRFIFDAKDNQGSFNIKTSYLLQKFNDQAELILGCCSRLLPFKK